MTRIPLMAAILDPAFEVDFESLEIAFQVFCKYPSASVRFVMLILSSRTVVLRSLSTILDLVQFADFSDLLT